MSSAWQPKFNLHNQHGGEKQIALWHPNVHPDSCTKIINVPYCTCNLSTGKETHEDPWAFWSDSKNMSQKIRCPLTGRSLWVQCLQSSSKPAKDTKWDPASKINKNRVKRNWERHWVSHTGYQAPRISLSPSPQYWIYKQTLLTLIF